MIQPVRGRAEQGADRGRLPLVGVLLGDRARPHASRSAGWRGGRSTGCRAPRSRRDWDWLKQKAKDPWNPAIGLADAALDGGRLPYVKIDTLRYDPYGLNADKLLRLCERAYPDAFDGVRHYLDSTADALPRSCPSAQLRPTPVAMRPLRRLVEYRNAA